MGGSQRMTITIANMLKKTFDVSFVVFSGIQEPIILQAIPTDIPVTIIDLDYSRKSKLLWNAFFVRKHIHNEKPDYVFASLCSLNLILIVATFFSKVRCVIRLDNYYTIESKIAQFLIKLLYPFSYKIISQQEDMTKIFENSSSRYRGKIHTIHNPIDRELISKLLKVADNPYQNKNNINYVWVANVTWNKGNDIAIKAMNEVIKYNKSACLYFVGSINNKAYYEDCMRLISDLDLKEYVIFVGFDANPYRWIKYCDCFVLPSRIEGLPNVLVDAMYLGKPVVAANCIAFMNYLVDNGRNGYIVPVEDYLALADAMKKAIFLKDLKMSYIPSECQDFINVFD